MISQLLYTIILIIYYNKNDLCSTVITTEMLGLKRNSRLMIQVFKVPKMFKHLTNRTCCNYRLEQNIWGTSMPIVQLYFWKRGVNHRLWYVLDTKMWTDQNQPSRYVRHKHSTIFFYHFISVTNCAFVLNSNRFYQNRCTINMGL